MKKVLPIVAVGVITLLFSSCVKRDYVCFCIESQGQNYTRNYEIGHVTNDRAQTLCDNKQKDLQAHYTTASCKVTF